MAKRGQKLINVHPHIEHIIWDDACASIGWGDGGDGLAVQRISSVGIVAEETKEHIVLAGTFAHDPRDPSTNCRIAIPQGWIVKRRKVKLA